MSRLIVKNLPKSITTEKLQEVFGQKGIVTDVQLKFTKNGKFRHFGFVGYKTPEEANIAMDYFNGSFINASRLQVEICAGLGDPKKPKAWSKYAADSSSSIIKKEPPSEDVKEEKSKFKKDKHTESSQIKQVLEKHKNDPLFAEFMEVHTKNNKSVWSVGGVVSSKPKSVGILPAHTDEASPDEESDSDDGDESKTENVANADISDLEYLKKKISTSGETDDGKFDNLEKKNNVKSKKNWIELYTVKVRGLPYTAKKKEVKQFFSPLKPKTIRIPPKLKGFAYVGFKTEKDMKRAIIKNLSFMAGRRISVAKTMSNKSVSKNTVEGKKCIWKEQEESMKNEETIAESGRIFIRNLAYTVTEDDLSQLFSKYGPVTEVIMPIDRLTRRAKGYALLTYMVPENAITAYTELDGSVFQGRMMHLLPGKAKQSLEELLEKEDLTFKQKQILKQKAEAASSHNWNTLFLGQNAIVDIIAETYDTTKEKVLDSGGKESVAVRLALGESQIVFQMREFLEENGVHLDAFNRPTTERSKTVLLVKNLPAKTVDTEIRTLFSKYGELGRIILPPSGVTAIVEFLEPSEARSAFMKLAYTRFKHLPLYLEWAPSNTFTRSAANKKSVKNTVAAISPSTVSNSTPASVPIKNERVPADIVSNSLSDEEIDEPESDATLFIKNINFKTTEDNIREHFKNCGAIHSVTIATRKDPNVPGQLLSMGYGFIQFKKRAAVEKALKTFQHSVLDEFSIELKRSNRTLQSDVPARKKHQVGKQTGSKLLVRNIPFQANRQEVVDLFKTFGELKGVRLPQKMVGTGSHRGFAFVEYLTKQDAKRAFKALCQSTHLYGRRLVLEWATNDEDVEEIRKRTAQNFLDAPKTKNLRKGTVDPEMEGLL